MALKDILDSIEKEAQKEVHSIEKKAHEQSLEIEKDAVRELEELQEEIDNTIKKEAKDILAQAEYRLRMKERNSILNVKRDLISTSFKKAQSKLGELDSPSYQKIIVSLLKEMDAVDYVIFPAKGKESETKQALKESGKNFSLSDTSIESIGGFRAQAQDVEIDNTFESLLTLEEEQLDTKVAQILFD